jgi:lactoylglutathione lyase
MKQITGINHVGIRVRDLGVTRAFYEKLGFEFVEGPVGPEPVAVMVHPCGVNMNFILNVSRDADRDNVLMDRSTKQTGYTHVALEVSDLGSVERQLDDLGIVITGNVELPTGARFVFVRDPDRNVIEFHRPAPNRPSVALWDGSSR